MSSEPTVFVVDDHAGIRKALRRLLESVGFAVRTFDSASAFLDEYDQEQAGCLVLDVRMPDVGGLQLQETLVSRGATLPIIFITGHGDVSAAVKGIKAGAVDFLEKPFDDEHLLGRVREALARDAQQRRSVVEQSEIRVRFQRLTEREKEIFGRVAGGQSNKEIAKHLDISYRTVETHRFRLMQKMQARSLSELISMAVVCGVYQLRGN